MKQDREPIRYSYYPGCSQMVTNKAYDISTREVAKALGVALHELDDWNCCGATAYVAIREEQAFLLSARNLALAEQNGGDVVTPCSGCYVALRKANKYIAANPGLRDNIQGALAEGDMHYDGTVTVRHFLEVVVNILGEQAVRECVRSPLQGLKVAPYYGCQVGRPFGEIDDKEVPVIMDHLIQWLGAEAIPFPLKAKCCGGLMMTTQPDIGLKLTGKLLQQARERGADCIVVCCPLCQMNLEGYQRKISAALKQECSIPVLYFTQLMGVAFGMDAKTLALRDSLTPVQKLLEDYMKVKA